MVAVSYPARFVLDYHFVKWIITQSQNKSKIVRNLLYIHNSSKENKKKQNLILSSDFEKLFSENIVKDKDLLRGGMCSYSFDEDTLKVIAEGKIDEYTQRGIMAIFLTDEAPCKIILLTTKEKIDEYKKLDFFQKLKDVSIKDETDGEYLIASYFKKFCNEKEYCDINPLN